MILGTEGRGGAMWERKISSTEHSNSNKSSWWFKACKDLHCVTDSTNSQLIYIIPDFNPKHKNHGCP